MRDCGAPHGIDFALRRAAEEGLCVTPRLLLSGRAICMTGGHGWHLIGREADGPDELRRAAREQIKAGADNVKLIASGGILTPGANIGNPQFTVDEMKAAVEEGILRARPPTHMRMVPKASSVRRRRGYFQSSIAILLTGKAST